MNISVCILTKNCEAKIKRCLELLNEFDDVVILDTGSADRTLDIIAAFPNVRVFQQNGISNFGETRNFLTSKAKHDWVLHVDSDEYVTGKFLNALHRLTLKEDTVYSILLRLVYRNQALLPFDTYSRRLYNKTKTSWSNRAVHESIIIPDGFSQQKIKQPLAHYSFDSLEQMFQKSLWYSSLFAEQFREKKRCSGFGPVWHGSIMFLKFYILKRAFLYGYNGFIVSFRQGVETVLKYAKLYEKSREQ
ncbi:MAG: glycosyltransferase family 2 protein [Planctomycetaceae bacterium]|jgi:glycosyltransferase involved in cell wall biosynthesis|nr:glycosyltransferase family 2 protein [Planctomycetaceae bacterium]